MRREKRSINKKDFIRKNSVYRQKNEKVGREEAEAGPTVEDPNYTEQ